MKTHFEKKNGSFVYWIAALLIGAGLLMLGRNFGLIPPAIYSLIVSWRMIFVVIGAYMFTRKQYFAGVLFLAIGGYFLLHKTGIVSLGIANFYWPMILIALGTFFILRHARVKSNRERFGTTSKEFSNGDGYFNIQNDFGSIDYVFVDDVLKGGVIKSSFGGAVVDLRRTSLAEGTVYIDVEMGFGGLDIHLPSSWYVKTELHSFLAGIEDARPTDFPIDKSRTLIIRGEITFGGVKLTP